MLKELPRYECLLKAAEKYPGMSPTACEAYLHLLRTGDDVFAAVDAFFTKHKTSQGRFTVLMLLHRNCTECCTPAALADEARVTRATMTGLIDTLEKDGMVIRRAHPQDRRTIHVRLTPKGRSFLNKMLPKYFQRVTAIIEPLNQTGQRQLVRLLQTIQRGLQPRTGAVALS
jgi:DNA-binding MarR family transcriptional regulator